MRYEAIIPDTPGGDRELDIARSNVGNSATFYSELHEATMVGTIVAVINRTVTVDVWTAREDE